jgi:hypothetical protein
MFDRQRNGFRTLKMKIYIACGLTHVPRSEFKQYVAFIHELANCLSNELGASVRYALQDSDPQLAQKPFEERARLCYTWDREMVEWADVVVADASYPSTGLGIELQIAENNDTPIVVCFNDSNPHKASPIDYLNPDDTRHTLQIGEGYVSLMVLGLPSVFKVIPYSNSESAFRCISDAVHLLDRTH